MLSQRALLSYILVFDHDSNLNLSQPADLEDVSIMNSMLFTKHVEILDNRFDMQMYTSTITKMSIFCSNNIDLTGMVQCFLFISGFPLRLR